MIGNWIFIPEGIDLPSSIIWGIATAAIGGILVELARSNLSSTKAFSRSLLIFIVSGFVWLAYYNVPFYSHFSYGDLKSSAKDDCSAGYSNWIHANELQPASGLPYLRVGKCLNFNYDYDRAIQWLEAGKGFEPQSEILTELGISYYHKNDYYSAITNLQEALKHDSENLDAQLLLGICLLTQRNVKDSLVELTKAIELAPKSPEAHFWLGWALYENYQYGEALPHFQYSIENNFKPGRAHAGLGFCNVGLENFGIAKQEFMTALSLDPNQSDVQQALDAFQNK